MRLTRRETLATVLLGGLGTGAGLQVLAEVPEAGREPDGDRIVTDYQRETLSAVAEAIYPSALTDPGVLAERYLAYQPLDRLQAIRDAILDLDQAAQRRYDAPFATLTTGERETLLREMGVDRVAAARDGTVSARIRYFLVDGLLFALVTNPEGSQLVGVDNPVGFPGGYEYGGDAPGGDSQ